MEAVSSETTYEEEAYKEYIYGSAEVVGLMCLMVFAEGDTTLYNHLEPYSALGAAFQKINFLRDMKSDYDDRGRIYFPGIDFRNFEEESGRRLKKKYEQISKWPMREYVSSRLVPNGGYCSRIHIIYAFHHIQLVSVSRIKEVRIRVSTLEKMFILLRTLAKQQLQIG
jgi:hypothetical protein